MTGHSPAMLLRIADRFDSSDDESRALMADAERWGATITSTPTSVTVEIPYWATRTYTTADGDGPTSTRACAAMALRDAVRRA